MPLLLPLPPPSRAVQRGGCLHILPKDQHLGNADAVSRHAGAIPVFELPALPPPELPLEPWYDDGATRQAFRRLLGALAERRTADAARVAGMKARGRAALWWPFTQHDDLSEGKVNVLDSAYGDYFCVADAEGGGESEVGGEVRRDTGSKEWILAEDVERGAWEKGRLRGRTAFFVCLCVGARGVRYFFVNAHRSMSSPMLSSSRAVCPPAPTTEKYVYINQTSHDILLLFIFPLAAVACHSIGQFFLSSVIQGTWYFEISLRAPFSFVHQRPCCNHRCDCTSPIAVPQVRVSHRALVDACASWWTQGAGHGNPGMALAVAEAAGRYGHVIFPGNIHAPALEVMNSSPTVVRTLVRMWRSRRSWRPFPSRRVQTRSCVLFSWFGVQQPFYFSRQGKAPVCRFPVSCLTGVCVCRSPRGWWRGPAGVGLRGCSSRTTGPRPRRLPSRWASGAVDHEASTSAKG